ncbi:MAG: energy-coupling factor transporter ATPase [Armatimonadetes bacterium]|nr:energy-coupling factor transporter ATPase [Armatimonadota bacterium]
MIIVKDLSHTYQPDSPRPCRALHNVSFTVENGEYIGIVGRSGSGKTTLVQHINRLLRPTSGAVLVDGQDINAPGFPVKEVRRKIGLVFQYPEHQLFEETVFEDVAFGPRNLGYSGSELPGLVSEALSLVGLSFDRYHSRSPFSLSGGEKRRVAIAGILAMKPRVLILDEPTAGLDPQGREAILHRLERLRVEQGLTILMVSHYLEELLPRVDRLLIIKEGSLLLSGTPRDIIKQSRELHGVGMEVPQFVALLQRLEEKGHPVRTDALSVRETVEELMKVMKGKGKGGAI